MNDRTPTGHRQSADRPPTVSVAQAAAALGITPDAVRGRLQRGTLAGEKIAGAWRVHLPGEAQQPVDQQATDGPPTGHRQDALVAHLEGEVGYLRERLEESDRQRGRLLEQLDAERRRADVLQALGTGATPGTFPDAPGSHRSDEPPATGIRAWVRRLWRG